MPNEVGYEVVFYEHLKKFGYKVYECVGGIWELRVLGPAKYVEKELGNIHGNNAALALQNALIKREKIAA